MSKSTNRFAGLFDETKLSGKPQHLALTHSRFLSGWFDYLAWDLVAVRSAFLWNTQGIDVQFIVELNSHTATQFSDYLNQHHASRPMARYPALSSRVITQDLSDRFAALAGSWTVVAVREVFHA